MHNVQNLLNLALGAQSAVQQKSAALGVGGQQVRHDVHVNPMSGIYDPSDAGATYSALSQMRAQGAAAQILDGQTSGTNLNTFRDQLNEAYQTVNYAVNPMMSGMKAANQALDINALNAQAAQEAFSTGYFEEGALPDYNTWEQIKQNVATKGANMAYNAINAMNETGIIDNYFPAYKPFLFGDKQASQDFNPQQQLAFVGYDPNTGAPLYSKVG